MSKVVLIIDDDFDLRETMQMLLEEAGYAVLGARDGSEALDLLGRSDPMPSLILLDLSMPIMNGRQFRARQVADRRIADIPVVVLSASGRIEEEAPAMSIAEALAKPFSPDALLAIVRRRCPP